MVEGLRRSYSSILLAGLSGATVWLYIVNNEVITLRSELNATKAVVAESKHELEILKQELVVVRTKLDMDK